MDGRVSVTIEVMDEWGLEKDVEKKLIPPGEVGHFVNHVKSRLDDNGQVEKDPRLVAPSNHERSHLMLQRSMDGASICESTLQHCTIACLPF